MFYNKTLEIIVTNGEWDYTGKSGWIGGRYSVPNKSGGYHELLKQWWDKCLIDNRTCLLISENNLVKHEFEKVYKNVKFKTLDYYDENVDIKLNLCEQWEIENTYDVIICQATLEHVYDPVMALKNMSNSLNDKGTLLLHTNVPGFEYHQFPRDYLRFYPDWFIDAENFIGNIKLTELCVVGFHIFAEYKRNINE